MTTMSTQLTTAAELERLSFPDRQVELVRGQLIVREPPGTWHGMIQSRLNMIVASHVAVRKLGAVFGQDTGFRIRSDPDTVRAADLAFVAADRTAQIPRRGYAALAPDLVAEILSPDDRPGEVLAKVGDWIDAGTRLVWVIDPEHGSAVAYRHDGTIALLDREGALDGEDVMPGFRTALADLLG